MPLAIDVERHAIEVPCRSAASRYVDQLNLEGFHAFNIPAFGHPVGTRDGSTWNLGEVLDAEYSGLCGIIGACLTHRRAGSVFHIPTEDEGRGFLLAWLCYVGRAERVGAFAFHG